MMKLAALGFVTLASLLSGCGKHQAVKELEAIAEKVCACKDRDCAREEWKATLPVIEKYRDEKASDSDLKAINAAGARMKECVAQIEKAQK